MSEETKSITDPLNAEPTASRSALPIWIITVTLVLMLLGAVYFDHHSGWFNKQVYPPYRSAEELAANQPQSGAMAAAQGKKMYETMCGICHGTDGLGKPGQAPALAGSEWVVTKGYDRLTRIPLAGLSGPMSVKGQGWNLAMAPMGATLSDADLAAVLTYIRTAWGNQAGEVTADNVKSVRAALGARPQPLTAEQLKAMPE
ncbi:MAG TPA: cytochrome c [Candidatus Acidoferrum sp.]|nr:cytochrome c [Candidatus Acidoferrum sp.]